MRIEHNSITQKNPIFIYLRYPDQNTQNKNVTIRGEMPLKVISKYQEFKPGQKRINGNTMKGYQGKTQKKQKAGAGSKFRNVIRKTKGNEILGDSSCNKDNSIQSVERNRKCSNNGKATS